MLEMQKNFFFSLYYAKNVYFELKRNMHLLKTAEKLKKIIHNGSALKKIVNLVKSDECENFYNKILTYTKFK